MGADRTHGSRPRPLGPTALRGGMVGGGAVLWSFETLGGLGLELAGATGGPVWLEGEVGGKAYARLLT
jgi:hypothetical protein